jgi:phosphocarrier protein
MTSENVTVINKTGLHARPANVFVKTAARHNGCEISIKKDGKLYNCKSIVSVLSASVKCGTAIELIANGDGEEQAIRDLKAAVQDGLGE